jgi:hypothetical protein
VYAYIARAVTWSGNIGQIALECSKSKITTVINAYLVCFSKTTVISSLQSHCYLYKDKVFIYLFIYLFTAAYKENCREAHAAAVKFIQDHCYNN